MGPGVKRLSYDKYCCVCDRTNWSSSTWWRLLTPGTGSSTTTSSSKYWKTNMMRNATSGTQRALYNWKKWWFQRGVGGVLQHMATQNCCRNTRFATTKSSRDSARLSPSINLLSTLNVMNSMNCTPSNHFYTLATPDSHWQVALFTPVCYPPPNTSHTEYVISANVPCVSVQAFRISLARQIEVGQFFLIFHSHFSYNTEQYHAHYGSVACINSYYHVTHLVSAVWTPTSCPTYWYIYTYMFLYL